MLSCPWPLARAVQPLAGEGTMQPKDQQRQAGVGWGLQREVGTDLGCDNGQDQPHRALSIPFWPRGGRGERGPVLSGKPLPWGGGEGRSSPALTRQGLRAAWLEHQREAGSLLGAAVGRPRPQSRPLLLRPDLPPRQRQSTATARRPTSARVFMSAAATRLLLPGARLSLPRLESRGPFIPSRQPLAAQAAEPTTAGAGCQAGPPGLFWSPPACLLRRTAAKPTWQPRSEAGAAAGRKRVWHAARGPGDSRSPQCTGGLFIGFAGGSKAGGGRHEGWERLPHHRMVQS